LGPFSIMLSSHFYIYIFFYFYLPHQFERQNASNKYRLEFMEGLECWHVILDG
jgi:hypothetical protein